MVSFRCSQTLIWYSRKFLLTAMFFYVVVATFKKQCYCYIFANWLSQMRLRFDSLTSLFPSRCTRPSPHTCGDLCRGRFWGPGVGWQTTEGFSCSSSCRTQSPTTPTDHCTSPTAWKAAPQRNLQPNIEAHRLSFACPTHPWCCKTWVSSYRERSCPARPDVTFQPGSWRAQAGSASKKRRTLPPDSTALNLTSRPVMTSPDTRHVQIVDKNTNRYVMEYFSDSTATKTSK